MIDKSIINIFCAIMIALTLVFSLPNKEHNSGAYSIACALFMITLIYLNK